MTLAQQIITIGLCVLGTMTTRFLPFLVFRENRETPKFIQYVGIFLPSAVFGMLVVYCLRNVNILQGTHGIPEFISILITAGLHIWKHQMLISIAGGTICYILLLHFCKKTYASKSATNSPSAVFIFRIPRLKSSS